MLLYKNLKGIISEQSDMPKAEIHLEKNYGCGFGEKIHRKLRKGYVFCFELVYGVFGFFVFGFGFFLCLFNSTGRSTASLD